MTTNAARLAELLDPASYDSRRPAGGVALVAHPDLEVLHQGTSWHRAGLAASAEAHRAIAAADRAIHPDGIRITELRTWQTADPDVAIAEYRNAATMWNGRQMANGGLAVVEFEDGMVRRVRNFTNTAYLQAIERGWEALLPYDTLLDVPAFHTIGLPVEHSRPYHPARDAKTEHEEAWAFERPWTNEQRVRLQYDPTTFELNGPPRPGSPFYTPTDDMYYEWQGTRWMMAGRNYVRDLLAAEASGNGIDFRVHPWLRFTHLKTWATDDDEWVFMEWMSRSETWTGRPFLNHGLTAMSFTGAGTGRLRAHREYCNVVYNETMEGNWRDQVPREQFATRATAATWDLASEDWSPRPIEEGAAAAPHPSVR